MSLLSRFQIIHGAPQIPPHQCSVCGSQSGDFIDFGLDLEMYGTVFLCVENCIKQVANELGFRSQSQHQVALDAVEEQRKIANDALDKVKDLEDVLGAYRRISNYSVSASDNLPSESVTDEGDEQSDSESAESPRQSAEWGRSDVQSDDSFNKLFSDFA